MSGAATQAWGQSLSGPAKGADDRLDEISYVKLVARIHAIAAGDGYEAVDLDRRSHPGIRVSDLASIGEHKGRKHCAPHADAQIRRELILDIGPLNVRPIGVVVELL
jgi:hypothetical protein